MSPQAVRIAFNEGLSALLALFEQFRTHIQELERTIAEQKETILRLEHRLHQNSQNSHNPPSSDRYHKPQPKSLRRPSGRPVGGQKGHPGHTLHPVVDPDRTVRHRPKRCAQCHHALDGVTPTEWERRQVFDLPPMKLEVTEHQAAKTVCPQCAHLNQASFPNGVTSPTQYGPQIRAFAVYLRQFQLIPCDRTRQLLEDLCGCSLSTATLEHWSRACYQRLAPITEGIHDQLRSASVLHSDETGVRVNSKRQWLHVASTPDLTAYRVHPKRGKEATDAMGILPGFLGRLIHDFWATYFRYRTCTHGMCIPHIERELAAVSEQTGHAWPQALTLLFHTAFGIVEQARAEGAMALPTEQRMKLHEDYRTLVARGKRENPLIPSPQSPARRGRKKQTKAQNLLDRLDEHETSVLAFVDDLGVPYSNNQAEQDIRMVKVQQKVSGAFRTPEGADIFCRVRGYISTARKQGHSVIDALRGVFEGTPFIPRGPT